MTYVSVLHALASPTRRHVFERLHDRPSTVGELASTMDVTQPAVSQHLAVLREAGLVTREVDGRRHVYRAETKGLEALRAYIDAFWDEALDAYRDSFLTQTEQEHDSTHQEEHRRTGDA